MRWTIEQKTRLAFALVFVTTVAIGIFSYQNAANFIAVRQLVGHTRQIVIQLQDTLSTLIDAETGQRGYLITGDESYLEPYTSAASSVDGMLQQLRTLTADEPSQQQQLDQLTPLVSAELADIQQAISAQREQGFDAARAVVVTGAGKRDMDQIRTLITTMEAEENNLLDQRSAQANASGNDTLLTIALLTILIVGLLGVTYVLISRDLSERRRIETLLGDERTLLRTLIDSLPDLIYVKDPAGRFLVANPAVSRVLADSTPDVLIGKTDFDFFTAEQAEEFRARELAILQTGKPLIAQEEMIVNASGAHSTLLTTKIPVRSGAGEIVQLVGIGHDITERKRAEEKVEQLNRSLQQQTRELEAANRELEAFSYSVSHDLRAPIRAIDGFSRILIDEYAPRFPQEAQHYLQMVNESAGTMGLLIDGLLSFSRLSRQPVKKQHVQTAELVHRVLDEELRGQWDQQKVKIDVGELSSCNADPVLLRQVYVNLLSNAIKFTAKLDAPHIEVGYQPEQGAYFVRDNGAGFDQRYVHKLFGVFQRLHAVEEYEGTGVGLAIVQRIIHRHGGRIWAEGQVGKGATFYFTLTSNGKPA